MVAVRRPASRTTPAAAIKARNHRGGAVVLLRRGATARGPLLQETGGDAWAPERRRSTAASRGAKKGGGICGLGRLDPSRAPAGAEGGPTHARVTRTARAFAAALAARPPNNL